MLLKDGFMTGPSKPDKDQRLPSSRMPSDSMFFDRIIPVVLGLLGLLLLLIVLIALGVLLRIIPYPAG
ncbi:MAG: hypothetical protein HY326_05790 [Chloroflexi bacterium]|nr:hypothetical protein [Chloroflexota bacterium]